MSFTHSITNVAAVRSILKNRYEKYHITTTFLQALSLAFQTETRDESEFCHPHYPGFLSCDDFWDYVGQMPLSQKPPQKKAGKDKDVPAGFGNFYIRESTLFHQGMDINIYTHLPYVNDGFHTHDHFELNYIYRGKGDFYFEDEHQTLKEGTLLIIAPDSPHNVRAMDQDFIISIMVRKSTFNKIFWSLLNKDTLVSSFFRNALSQNNERNYVLFQTDNCMLLQNYLQQLMSETGNKDAFVNDNMVSILLLFISFILRNFSDSAKFYNVESISVGNFDINLLYQYIRQNYATVTLKELADKFHYSEAFFSRLFKKKFGKSFSSLIREFRLSAAKELLRQNNYTIKEVCDIVGYNSVSAFSRSYKEYYGISPKMTAISKKTGESEV